MSNNSRAGAAPFALFETLPSTIRVRRPVVRWFGGKWKMAPTIIKHFAAHRVYVEPFGGGGSVLLRKPRSYAEIYNDLDGDIVNLFRVLRDEALSARLIEQLRLTPFAREEFKAAYALTDEPIERARRLITLSFQGFGSNAHARRSTGFRSNSNRLGTTPAHDWGNFPDALAVAIDRLRGVVIENRDACEVMAQQDSDKTLHYVDPPYIHSTRGRNDKQRQYRHEMNDEQHRELLAFLPSLKGHVVLSGYAHPMYDEALPGWRRVEFNALADGALPRKEVLWIKEAA
jgi:DNA adenine methylase